MDDVAAERVIRVGAVHHHWRGTLLLSPSDRTVVHEEGGSEGTYRLSDGILAVHWEKFAPDVFMEINGAYVSQTLLKNNPKLEQLHAVSLADRLLIPTKVSVHLPAENYEVTLRLGTTDLPTFTQIFVQAEYDSPNLPKSARAILDLGANIGLATVFFALRYPEARIVSVEPDPENFKMLQANVVALGSRAEPWHAAVWNRDGLVGLRMQNEEGRPLGAWGTQAVEQEKNKSSGVRSYTLRSILNRSKIDTVDILKLDVEGAEFEVFSEGSETWLSRINLIIVETHDRLRPGAEDTVRNALAGRFDELPPRGENLFFRRREGHAARSFFRRQAVWQALTKLPGPVGHRFPRQKDAIDRDGMGWRRGKSAQSTQPPEPNEQAVLRYEAAQKIVNQGYYLGGEDERNKTYGCVHQLPPGSVGVRFELANALTSESATYRAAFAVSAGLGDWFTPLNSDGVPDDSLWTPVTAGSSESLQVSRASSSKCVGRLLTDPMEFRVPAPRRIDGGAGVCLFFRIYCTAGRATICGYDGTVAPCNGYPNGARLDQFSQTLGASWANFDDRCTSPVPYYAPAVAPLIVPWSVIPILPCPALTVMSIGDSMLSGVSSRSALDCGANGVGMQMAKGLSRSQRPALHRNEALSGAKCADFLANGDSAIRLFRPNVLLLQAFSANDFGADTTEDQARSMFEGAMRLRSAAESDGVAVVMVTSPPFAGDGSPRMTPDWERTRKFADSLIRSAGVPYLDADLVLGAGNNPVSYQAGYTGLDHIHPNDSGAGVLAQAGIELLRERFAIT